MGKDKRTHFWASYADLMTSLFFLMVVLFIISIVELKQIDATPLEVKELKAERDSLLNLNWIVCDILPMQHKPILIR